MLLVAQSHRSSGEGVECRDTCLKRFGVRGDGFEVFNAYTDMKLFLYLEVFELQIIYNNRCLQRLLQYIYIASVIRVHALIILMVQTSPIHDFLCIACECCPSAF